MTTSKPGDEQEQHDDHLKKLGERFMHFRKLRGFGTYEKFANKYNLNRTQIGRYEAGKSNIEFNTIVKILKLLEVPVSEFFSNGFDD